MGGSVTVTDGTSDLLAIDGGAGDDTLNIGVGSSVDTRSNVSFEGGDGTDRLNLTGTYDNTTPGV